MIIKSCAHWTCFINIPKDIFASIINCFIHIRVLPKLNGISRALKTRMERVWNGPHAASCAVVCSGPHIVRTLCLTAGGWPLNYVVSGQSRRLRDRLPSLDATASRPHFALQPVSLAGALLAQLLMGSSLRGIALDNGGASVWPLVTCPSNVAFHPLLRVKNGRLLAS